ncbi:MAG: hypothetical protein VX970_05190 [Planctomycetota bacterium]|nr:hypothetical protein [Planctomycetota bacterium]
MTANTTSRAIHRGKSGKSQRKRVPVHILLPGIAAFALLYTVGCSSSEQQAENTQAGLAEKLTAEEIAKLPRVNGIPLGHLKPRTGKKQSDNKGELAEEFARRPHVRWVLEGEQLTELDPPEPLDTFRIDFDETRRLTFNDLPYAFMTENSREVVIRRGDVIQGSFQDPRISPDEDIVLVFSCKNVDCPRRREVAGPARFPYNPAGGQSPVCPFCKSKDKQGKATGSSRFKTSQAHGLEQEIQRQFYRNRAKRDADR